MAKDITLKNADGSVIYYPKTVSDLVYDNESGKTVKEEIDKIKGNIIYTFDDVLEKNIFYYNGSLNVGSVYTGRISTYSSEGGQEFYRFPIITLDKGSFINIKVLGGNGSRAYCICRKSDNVILYLADANENYLTTPFTYTAEEDVYVYVNVKVLTEDITTKDVEVSYGSNYKGLSQLSNETNLLNKSINTINENIVGIKDDIDNLQENVNKNTNDIESLSDEVDNCLKKVEAITKIYDASFFDFTNKYYNNGSLNVGSVYTGRISTYSSGGGQGFAIAAPIELTKGETLELKIHGGSGGRAYCICRKSDNVIIQKAESSQNFYDNPPFIYTAEEDVIIYCTHRYLTTTTDYNNPYYKISKTINNEEKINDLYDRFEVVENKVDSLDADEINPVDKMPIPTDVPLKHIKQEIGLSGIFKSWGFIGGSVTSGEIECYDPDGTKHYYDQYWYSWGQFMCRMTGANGYNYSNGGGSARSWITRTSGVHDYKKNADGTYQFDKYGKPILVDEIMGFGGGGWKKAQEEPKQAYIISFASNDVSEMMGTREGVEPYPLGTPSDIDFNDYNNNAQSFYGYYGGVIQRLRSLNPRCKIFVASYPKGMLDDVQKATGIYDAIRNMTTLFDNVYLIDLDTYSVDVNNAEFVSKYRNGYHWSGAGYQYWGWMMMNYIDWIVRNNLEKFKDIQLIGTDRTLTPLN